MGLAKVAAALQDNDLVAQRLVIAQALYGELEVDEGWLVTIETWLGRLEEE